MYLLEITKKVFLKNGASENPIAKTKLLEQVKTELRVNHYSKNKEFAMISCSTVQDIVLKQK